MDPAVTDLQSLAHFFYAANPDTEIIRDAAILRVTTPEDKATLMFEWEAGVLHVRLPIGVVAEQRLASALEQLSDINATLGILGFVLHRPSGWVELRFSVFANPDGSIATPTLAKVVVSMQDTVTAFLPQLEELCRVEVATVAPWWAE